MNSVRVFALMAVACIVGCGGSDQPDVGEVTGTVKLDGKALANAQVEFQPDEGRPSIGTTDDSGKYELLYTKGVMGAKVGDHTVKVTTGEVGEDDAGNPKITRKEQVPDSYNTNSTLKKTVKPGAQEIDLELDSSNGKIVQPSLDGSEPQKKAGGDPCGCGFAPEDF